MAYSAYRLVFPARSFFPCFSPTFFFSKQRTMLNKLIDKAKRPLSPRSPRKESDHSAEDEHLSVGLPPTPRGSEEAVSKNKRSIAESPPKGKIDWVNTYDVYLHISSTTVLSPTLSPKSSSTTRSSSTPTTPNRTTSPTTTTTTTNKEFNFRKLVCCLIKDPDINTSHHHRACCTRRQ